MKAITNLLLIFTALVAGCTSLTQNASTTVTDPMTGIVETRTVSGHLFTRGDAKTAVESLSGSATAKTAHIGAKGVSEDSNVTDMINAISTLIKSVFESGVAAGKAAAK